ncbi:MAG TPA: hypothetical protein K8W07_11570 [Bacteroides togonis]|uniref:Uncharacterized protein n=1 Tax=Caecibacteroides pullorum TaxID=2725562 RepID=A0AA40ZVD7_9BACT|nr:hypothetical protein [Caecibacteroides pullorum]MBM6858851.1 hypothetical protein [Caecibacteroides pullorum]MBV8059861.1 hypothetical protein [Caecibacteroides pullorum]HJD95585.1 hypothetical protein [Bacteroides togonis]
MDRTKHCIVIGLVVHALIIRLLYRNYSSSLPYLCLSQDGQTIPVEVV